jgi:predicted acylesterase/phospholipase RssA
MTSQSAPSELPPCDLVMKGGATSGVIYPPVIAELAERYRFVNIGGTSAGAIASAVTAAAEYGRQRGHQDTFDALNGLSAELGEPGMLLGLFRSTAPTHLRPLLDTLLPLVSDPGAASGQPVDAPPPGMSVPPFVRRIAPELFDLIFPPRPAQAQPPDERLSQTLRAVLTDLADTHPEAYHQGATAGAVAGTRLGQYLLIAAGLLMSLFAIPLALVIAPLIAWVAWAVIGGLLIALSYWGGQKVGQAAVAAGGTANALVSLGRLLLEDVPGNLYGICTGHRSADHTGDDPALTDWLSDWINRLAGRTDHGGPLTFGDLHRCTIPPFPGDEERQPSRKKTVEIKLRMVTTNLSHGRPYVLPFDTDLVLLFRRGDLRQLFPADILDYLCQEQHTNPGWSLDALNAGLAPDHDDRISMLPNGESLPVIVGMRMSLSFPILISAVRLYTVSADCTPDASGTYQPRREHLQENWFSDGGICSNFPIHFFDAWLPTHPTFGINLTSLPQDAFKPTSQQKSEEAAPSGPEGGAVRPAYVSRIAPDAPVSSITAASASPEHFLKSALLGEEEATPLPQSLEASPPRVLLPDAEQPLDPIWRPVESVTRFVWSMFDTAMNYRDTTQLMLPSYKERAVQIRLDGTREGGLNLNMPAEILQNLQQYGHDAGELLRDGFDFDRHRWVRFRVLMGELERQLLSMEGPLSAMAAATGGQTVYEQLMDRAGPDHFPFGEIAQPHWVSAADTRMRALRALIGAWREANIEDAEDQDISGERRVDDLSRVLFALTNVWRSSGLTPEQSEQRMQELLALMKGWNGSSEYVGREVRSARFFKPVAHTGLELRVTPEL